MLFTTNEGRLFDDLGTTKYAIKRLIEIDKLEFIIFSIRVSDSICVRKEKKSNLM
jgi:hypothetical protein